MYEDHWRVWFPEKLILFKDSEGVERWFPAFKGNYDSRLNFWNINLPPPATCVRFFLLLSFLFNPWPALPANWQHIFPYPVFCWSLDQGRCQRAHGHMATGHWHMIVVHIFRNIRIPCTVIGLHTLGNIFTTLQVCINFIRWIWWSVKLQCSS